MSLLAASLLHDSAFIAQVLYVIVATTLPASNISWSLRTQISLNEQGLCLASNTKGEGGCLCQWISDSTAPSVNLMIHSLPSLWLPQIISTQSAARACGTRRERLPDYSSLMFSMGCPLLLLCLVAVTEIANPSLKPLSSPRCQRLELSGPFLSCPHLCFLEQFNDESKPVRKQFLQFQADDGQRQHRALKLQQLVTGHTVQ